MLSSQPAQQAGLGIWGCAQHCPIDLNEYIGRVILLVHIRAKQSPNLSGSLFYGLTVVDQGL